MLKKLLIATTATTLSLGILLPTTSTFAASVNEKPTVVSVDTDTTTKEVEAAGGKGLVIKGALYTIKGAVKAGDWILGLIEEHMSNGAIKYLKNNTSKINKGLDNAIKRFDDAQNYAQETVRSIIYQGLRDVKVPPTYAEDIAENMAAVVSFLAF
ncbi:hypothetical protein [Niallia sp. Marseille-Q9988]